MKLSQLSYVAYEKELDRIAKMPCFNNGAFFVYQDGSRNYVIGEDCGQDARIIYYWEATQ